MITSVPGSSEYFLGGIIAYSNDAKKKLLGVRPETIERHGAVSAETAVEMAEGVRKRFRSTVGVSITGIAGPGGSTARKPVGTVFICVAAGGRGVKPMVRKFLFSGTRKEIKRRSATAALSYLALIIEERL